jgi:hypothetical protein
MSIPHKLPTPMVRKIIGTNWIVYRLVNHTKQEIYFGCTKDFEDRFKEHASEETKAIKHWDFAGDRIDESLVRAGLTQKAASDLEHELDHQIDTEFPNYKVIATCGI